jgi:hypothetical protein
MWLIMEGEYRERLFEGLTYYVKSILFIRPMRRIIIRFIRKVLMRRYTSLAHGVYLLFLTVMWGRY